MDADRARAQVFRGIDYDVCAQRLAEQRVWYADDGRLLHARYPMQCVLDLCRADFFAASLNDVIGPSDKVEEPSD